MARRRRYRGTPVPPLHLVLIYSCTSLSVLSGLAYFFAPAGKAETFAGVLLTLIGFLAGKMSNSFGKPLLPRDLDLDGDGVLDSQQEAEDGAVERAPRRAAPARGVESQ